MKVIIEGIDGVGKTTIIKAIEKELSNRKIQHQVIDEIEESPISEVLTKMLHEDPFFQGKKNFDTSVFESLLLAADHQYKQSCLNLNDNVVNIFDRDYPTILVYQERIMRNFYGDKINSFMPSFKNVVLFNNAPVDLLIYVQVPLQVSVDRVVNRSRRENEQFQQAQVQFLGDIKNDFEEKFLPMEKQRGTNILVLNGMDNPENNAQLVVNTIENISNSSMGD